MAAGPPFSAYAKSTLSGLLLADGVLDGPTAIEYDVQQKPAPRRGPHRDRCRTVDCIALLYTERVPCVYAMRTFSIFGSGCGLGGDVVKGETVGPLDGENISHDRTLGGMEQYHALYS